MTDIVPAKKRSEMMAGIRGKDTKPELLVRKALYAAGYRYRLHRRDLPGTPDIVLPGRRVVIFVHGCFWHRHSGCNLAKVPSTRSDFWVQKLESNKERDNAVAEALRLAGWRVLVVWECFTRSCKTEDAVLRPLIQWLEGTSSFGELEATR